MEELKFKAIKLIAQIQVPIAPPVPSRVEVKAYSSNSDITGYVLAACGTAFVALLGVAGAWLRKYFDTRLELSIARQKEEFTNNKEDRDRSQSQLREDRERSQKQADIFLTTTLGVIKEEKDSHLEALQGIKAVLVRMDTNQAEITRQIIEVKGETSSNTLRIANMQNAINVIYGKVKSQESKEKA